MPSILPLLLLCAAAHAAKVMRRESQYHAMKNPLCTVPLLLSHAAVLSAVASAVAAAPAPKPAAKPAAATRAAVPRPAPRTVADARSWCLYYGGWATNVVDRLAQYELVVVDPAALGGKADETIAALHARGCLVAGYLSCFEVAKWHRYLPRVKEEWRVKVDGRNWVPWGANEAASLAEPEWRALLVELMRTEVFDHGCDGVFMDTLADLDHPGLPEDERARQLEGLGAFAAAYDAAYPDRFFVGNWTIQRTLPVLAPHLDALCWEDFDPKHFEGSARGWMEGIAKKIGDEAAKHPFRVLTLWNADAPGADLPSRQKKMREISARLGCLPFCTSGGYHRLPAPGPEAAAEPAP